MTDSPRQRFLDWISKYESAWRAAGTRALDGLFSADAIYLAAPFDEPLRGVEAIAAFWEAERESHREAFTLTASIVAADGGTAVARVEVIYGEPTSHAYRDLWIITLDDKGLCTVFEEWPSFPGQLRAAPR